MQPHRRNRIRPAAVEFGQPKLTSVITSCPKSSFGYHWLTEVELIRSAKVNFCQPMLSSVITGCPKLSISHYWLTEVELQGESTSIHQLLGGLGQPLSIFWMRGLGD